MSVCVLTHNKLCTASVLDPAQEGAEGRYVQTDSLKSTSLNEVCGKSPLAPVLKQSWASLLSITCALIFLTGACGNWVRACFQLPTWFSAKLLRPLGQVILYIWAPGSHLKMRCLHQMTAKVPPSWNILWMNLLNMFKIPRWLEWRLEVSLAHHFMGNLA